MADRPQLIQAAVAALDAAATDPASGLDNRQRDLLKRTAQRILRWADPAAPTTSATSGLLTRSQYARAAGVAMQTLIDWEKAGRLVPTYRNPLNGYRYYAPEQVAQARSIRQRRRN
jgi:ABC-type oligopeptide transport system substrate-binding subunit